jgi:hypothetical protein
VNFYVNCFVNLLLAGLVCCKGQSESQSTDSKAVSVVDTMDEKADFSHIEAEAMTEIDSLPNLFTCGRYKVSLDRLTLRMSLDYSEGDFSHLSDYARKRVSNLNNNENYVISGYHLVNSDADGSITQLRLEYYFALYIDLDDPSAVLIFPRNNGTENLTTAKVSCTSGH